MSEPKNLMDGLFDEMNRVREIIKIYEDLPSGAGRFAAALMKQNIEEAEQSIKDNDVIEMLKQYNSLKTWEL